ncbi:hypothetical protein ACIODX_06390 [Streptomyces sp. NPDC088190]|nr:hypothetical protein [Streptomyces sp. JV190]MEE1844853.1 hypothetical protein [Streptomyces sp. JV190]
MPPLQRMAGTGRAPPFPTRDAAGSDGPEGTLTVVSVRRPGHGGLV